ncbi:MAG: hypothetical protein D6731_10975 [Planctomycetota bacterium]|nr:MAG: hypothetical protein D6731_10975 [Planctomycetota bacterium]
MIPRRLAAASALGVLSACVAPAPEAADAGSGRERAQAGAVALQALAGTYTDGRRTLRVPPASERASLEDATIPGWSEPLDVGLAPTAEGARGVARDPRGGGKVSLFVRPCTGGVQLRVRSEGRTAERRFELVRVDGARRAAAERLYAEAFPGRALPTPERRALRLLERGRELAALGSASAAERFFAAAAELFRPDAGAMGAAWFGRGRVLAARASEDPEARAEAAASFRRAANSLVRAGRAAEAVEAELACARMWAESAGGERERLERARAAAERARRAARGLAAEVRARCARSLGSVLHAIAWALQPDRGGPGPWSEVEALYRSAVQRRAQGGDGRGAARSLQNLACAAQPDRNPSGDWEEAARRHGEAAAAWRRAGDGPAARAESRARAVCLLRAARALPDAKARALLRAAGEAARAAGDAALAERIRGELAAR